MLHYLHLPIPPVPASRPRVSKWGTYYGKRHQAFRSAALACLEELREQGDLPKVPLSGRLALVIVIEVEKPKSSKRDAPAGDVDNYAKIVMDCCNKIVWDDDSLVDVLTVRKDWAIDRPGVHMWIKEIMDGSVGKQVRSA